MNNHSQDFLGMFKAYLANSEYAFSTQAGYFINVRLFCQWFENNKKKELHPQYVTPIDIQEYQQYLLQERYKKHTINQKLTSISIFMKWAKTENLTTYNPVRKVQQSKGKKQRHKIHYLNQEEQVALLYVIEENLKLGESLRAPSRLLVKRRNASLVMFLLNTGLHLSEALSLRLQNLEVSEQKGNVKILWTKEKQRKVPLNQNARKALQSWLQIRPEHKENDHLWIAMEHEVNGALNNRSTQRVVRTIGEKAGLTGLTPLTLRHTFAKNLIDQGVGLEKVAALLGLESLDSAWLHIISDDQDLEVAVESIA